MLLALCELGVELMYVARLALSRATTAGDGCAHHDVGRSALQEVCSPYNCDYLLSKGWEVPLANPRPEPEPVPPFDMQACAPLRVAPPAGVSGVPTGLAIDDVSRRYWVLYNDAAGRGRHWLVETRYSGTVLRAIEIFGVTNPTGEATPRGPVVLSASRVAVIDQNAGRRYSRHRRLDRALTEGLRPRE